MRSTAPASTGTATIKPFSAGVRENSWAIWTPRAPKITQTMKLKSKYRNAANNVGHVRVAKDEDERALLWKARKSAFGACARVKPNYFLHDCVVPRSRLVEVMQAIIEITDREDLICLNVFHAGDGNLHPIIAFDRRDADEVERVKRAGDAIIRKCVEVGGTLSGEHGIGLEKRDYMPLVFTEEDLEAQACMRRAFDPDERLNPHKVLPLGARCGEAMLGGREPPEGTWI